MRNNGHVQLTGTSAVMIELKQEIERIARSDAKVLVTGESGVGKELVANAVHTQSPRGHRPFVAVNCAGLPETLLESELFGHVRGSFTGAYRDRAGKLQMAHGGTLLLDEVGEMSLRMQALLLRFLENGEVQTIGDSQARTLDVRIIAATNRNLPERVAAGEFREDLLYRLRVIQIAVPALRERPDDIPALIEHFLRRAPRAMTCAPEAEQALLRYKWPGNIRELQNVIEQAIWLAPTSTITLADLPEGLRTAGNGMVPTRERRRQISEDLFQALVQGHYSFWDHVHPLFLNRDLTRHDIRELVARGLSTTKGNYRAVLKLFGMDASDYYRFHNFLTAHDCKVDFRTFRTGAFVAPMRRQGLPKVS
jgi:transcriptional regulator with PAS, ATPase and Fis domain